VMLASMLAVAIRDLITRRLPKDLPTVLLTASSAIGVLLVGPLMMPFEQWQVPSPTEYLVLFVCAATVLVGYVFIIIAMRHGATGVVSPFRYASMVFAVLSSVLIFNESPDRLSWFGIALIVGSGLYMVHRERAVRAIKLAPASALH
jgi:drug/metabolite transporter (DMT)-like permease